MRALRGAVAVKRAIMLAAFASTALLALAYALVWWAETGREPRP